jgi:ribonuclease-3
VSGEARRRRLRGLLALAGVRRPGDLTTVETAFVHESWAKESGEASNERLEFLGDSVLSLIAAQWLFERYGDEDEGLLTLRRATIVNDGRLAASAARLGFSAIVRLGAGMSATGGAENTTVLAGAFEAFIAALYMAYGVDRARAFVISEHIEHLDQSRNGLIDPKTRLQHYAQAHLAATPVYREVSAGTPQEPAFRSRVSVKGKTLGTGHGASKKAAQRAAAEAALLSLQVPSN